MLDRNQGTALSPLSSLTRDFDRFLGGFFDHAPLSAGARPLVSIWEAGDAYLLDAEVPGLRADDIDITVVDNIVTLKGTREETEREGARLLRREGRPLDFERRFEMPVSIDGEKIEASLENGILHVTLPKAQAHLPRKVKVITKGD